MNIRKYSFLKIKWLYVMTFNVNLYFLVIAKKCAKKNVANTYISCNTNTLFLCEMQNNLYSNIEILKPQNKKETRYGQANN